MYRGWCRRHVEVRSGRRRGDTRRDRCRRDHPRLNRRDHDRSNRHGGDNRRARARRTLAATAEGMRHSGARPGIAVTALLSRPNSGWCVPSCSGKSRRSAEPTAELPRGVGAAATGDNGFSVIPFNWIGCAACGLFAAMLIVPWKGDPGGVGRRVTMPPGPVALGGIGPCQPRGGCLTGNPLIGQPPP